MAPIANSSSPRRARSTGSPCACPSSMAPSGILESSTPWVRSGPPSFAFSSLIRSSLTLMLPVRSGGWLENKPSEAEDVGRRHSSTDDLDAVKCKGCLIIGPIDRGGRIVWRTVLDLLAVDMEMDQPVRPIDLSYRARRDQDFLSRPPVPGIDGDETDAPAGIVHEKILDVADLAVDGMDMVPGDGGDAAKMRIAFVGPSFARPRAGQERRRGERHSHRAARHVATPIGVPAVVIVDMGLQLPRHRLIRVDIRAVLDLLHRQFDRELAQGAIGLPEGRKRQKDFATGKPIAGVDDQPSDGPANILEQQVADGPEPAVARFDGVTTDCRRIPQH